VSKEKRTYNAEVVTSSSLQLRRTTSQDEQDPDQLDRATAKKQTFSTDLISRLAERIKKL